MKTYFFEVEESIVTPLTVNAISEEEARLIIDSGEADFGDQSYKINQCKLVKVIES